MIYSTTDLGYRSRAEAGPWQEGDPVLAIGKKLSADRKQMIDDEVEAEIARAIELAESAPWPPPSELYTDVYKETI